MGTNALGGQIRAVNDLSARKGITIGPRGMPVRQGGASERAVTGLGGEPD